MGGRHIWWTAGVAAGAFCPAALLAQEAPTSVVEPAVALEAQEPSANSEGLPEIIVTAQKRPEDVQRAALSITAIPGDQLRNQGVADMATLSKLVPSVQIFDRATGTNIAIRGVISINAMPQGDPSIALNVDEVYVARPQASRTILFDVDRVEVLRGPQGTVYGRNATAGAVNIISRNPVDHFEAEAGIEVGSYDTFGVNGMVNVPLGDVGAVRAAFQTHKHDGYIGPYEDADSIAGRLKLLLRPTSGSSLLFTANYSHQGGVGSGDVAFPYVRPEDPWFNSNYPESWGNRDDTQFSFSGKGTVDLGVAELIYIGAYSKLDQDSRVGQTAALSEAKIEAEQWTNELRLVSTNTSNRAGSLKWLLGAYHFDETVLNNGSIRNPITRKTFGPYALVVLTDEELRSKSIAGFAQLTYSFLDTVRGTAGVRYTEDRKSQSGSQLQTAGGNTTLIPATGKVKFSDTSFKFALEADLAPRVLAYASITSGFHSGGLFESLAPRNFYEPEELTSYEVGLKSRLFRNRLQLNLSAYLYDYTNYQAQVTRRPIFPTIVNAAKARFKGAEAEGVLLVGSHGTFNFAVAYADPRFNEFCVDSVIYSVSGGVIGTCNGGPGYDLQDYDVPFISKWSGTFGYQHVFPLANGSEIRAGITSQLRSDFAGSLSANPLTRINGYTSTDITLAYAGRDNRWQIMGYVRNLEDDENPTWAGITANRANRILSAPRRFGVRLEVRF